MSWVIFLHGRLPRIYPNKVDMDIFKITKSRQEYRCRCCLRDIKKGSYKFGYGWTILCLKCGEKFGKKAIEEINKKVIGLIKTNQGILKKNKKIYERANLIASL